ncbi:MAG TPA: DUF1254 domain-containing protein [Chitinophagaceae bacterium]|jgi:hypothetical protein|nr:DUF1254 domain-containing protein [Chitinophagaceae bacterium]
MATQTATKEKIQATSSSAIPVTVDNFRRAESDMYFNVTANKEGGFGKFFHRRELFSVDNQTVVRGNRDTVYSSAVFDLDAGPVTITLPDAGKRFMSMMMLNEDQYAFDVTYGAGNYTITREQAGTRYVLVALRTLIDPANPGDLKEVTTLQDAVKVSQPGGPGKFEVPNWDAVSQKKVRDALLVLASTIQDFKHAFGKKEDVDPVRHLIGTAAGWGGNPDKEATYLNVTPPKNDGKTNYKLVVKDVPVDAFWSVSVYNKEGYYEKNAQNAYAINNMTATKETDGSVIIQFGGCDREVTNCIPIVDGWNYTVRLYRPRPEIVNGKWKFAEPEPVN